MDNEATVTVRLESTEGGDRSGPPRGPAPAPSPTPPPQDPNTARFYHGGHGTDGKRWLSPDQAYAEGYARKSGGDVSYVDIPKDNPNLQKAFDDSGTSQTAPFLPFEAGEEITKNLKPLFAKVGDWFTSTLADLDAQLAKVGVKRGQTAPAGPGSVTDEIKRLADEMHERDAKAMAVAEELRARGTPAIGTRGEVLLRDKERREREAQAQPAEDPAQATAKAAKEAMEKDAKKREVDLLRRQIDPAYRIRKEQEEFEAQQRAAQKAEREARRAEGPPIKAEIVKDKGWALEQAKRDMENEQARKLQDQARREIDPGYAKKKDEEDERRRQREENAERSQLAQRATFTAMALGQAGMGGLAKIPAGFAAGMQGGAAATKMTGIPGLEALGGPAGAITAAVKLAIDKLTEGIQAAFKIGAAIVSFDADRLARGFADLATKVPLVGGLMGALGHGILDLSDSIANTAQHLSQYNGALATQLANYEVEQINRDIRRAQQFGPEIMAAMESRQEFQRKLNEFMDRYTPMFLKIAEKCLAALTSLMDAPAAIQAFVLEQIAGMLEVFSAMLPGDWLRGVIAHLRTIARNTDPASNDDANTDTLLGNFFNMQGGLQTAMPQVAAPAIAPVAFGG